MNYPNRSILAATLVLAFSLPVMAQDQPQGKASLGIGAVKTTESTMQAAQRAGTLLSLNRVIQAMDGQLMDRLQNTRKFTLVSRSDLPDLLKEQNLAASGNIDKDDAAAAQAFKLAGCKYLVIATIDNF